MNIKTQKSKKINKYISLILLIVMSINLIFMPPVYAGNLSLQEAIEENALYDEDDPVIDQDDPEGEATRAEELITTGTARRHRDDERAQEVSGGTNALATVLSIVGQPFALVAAAVQMLMTFMYWEEPPADIQEETHNGIKTNLFTIENLVFNRVKILDANFFRDNENTAGINQKIKDNVATWHFIMKGFATVLLLLVIIYLAIKLIIASISSNPGPRAKAKLMMTDVVKALAIALLVHIYIGIMLYGSDIIVQILDSVRKGMVDNSVLNFEKVIIYDYLDPAGLFGSGRYLINMISYVLLVIIQVKFLIVFTQRFLTIAFLTIISPLIAVTYPVDMEKDGKSQIFSKWSNEISKAIFLMPFYAAIYLVFVVAASGLAERAPILGLIFLIYFERIEKIIKGLFDLRGMQTIRSAGGIELGK